MVFFWSCETNRKRQENNYGFEKLGKFWNVIQQGIKRYCKSIRSIDEPVLPRKRNLFIRKDSHPECFLAFTSTKNYHRKIFFEILDEVEDGYRERFELNNAYLKYCIYAEKFNLKKYGENNDRRDEERAISSEESVEDKKNHITQKEKIEAELQKLCRNNFTDFSGLKYTKICF